MLLRQISERKIKGLPKFPGKKTTKRKALENQRIELKNWLATIAGEIDVMSITPIRTWFELNDQGRHTPPAKKSGINARAIAVVKVASSFSLRLLFFFHFLFFLCESFAFLGCAH